jgi:hypothetical protein
VLSRELTYNKHLTPHLVASLWILDNCEGPVIFHQHRHYQIFVVAVGEESHHTLAILVRGLLILVFRERSKNWIESVGIQNVDFITLRHKRSGIERDDGHGSSSNPTFSFA